MRLPSREIDANGRSQKWRSEPAREIVIRAKASTRTDTVLKTTSVTQPWTIIHCQAPYGWQNNY